MPETAMNRRMLAQRIADDTTGGCIMTAMEEALMDSVNHGACTACGEIHYDACEPDMRKGYCEFCEESAVASILVLAGMM
tara:strand:+ start:729 stop:968 length:240 start_codon:yes stop_codon:yes gene_type:complete